MVINETKNTSNNTPSQTTKNKFYTIVKYGELDNDNKVLHNIFIFIFFHRK